MTGTKEQPKDIFGSPIRSGDLIAYIKHGGLERGYADSFTAFGVRVVDVNGEKIGTVLRDRVVGSRSLGPSA